jgi:hypothetical protein
MRKKQRIATADDWIRKEKLVQQTFDGVLGKLPRNGADDKRSRARRTRSRGSDWSLIRMLAQSISQVIPFSSTQKLVQEDVEREIAYRLELQQVHESTIMSAKNKLASILDKKFNRRAYKAGAEQARADFLGRTSLRARARAERIKRRALQDIKEAKLRIKRAAARVVFIENKREKILAGLWS